MVEPKIAVIRIISGFKFGDLVQDHHTYICELEILADFNLAVVTSTTIPPNLIPCQIFRLYGIHIPQAIFPNLHSAAYY